LGLATALLLASVPAWSEQPISVVVATGQYGFRPEVARGLGLDLEVRPAWRWNGFRPVAGVLTGSGGGAYVYTGFIFEVPLPGGLRLGPGFAPGLVLANGGRDLGSPIEFRSSLELSASSGDALRLGVTFSHISNARLGDHNPGVETLMLTLAVPGRD
jgi:lipid A 3-O-deacylase